MPTLTSISPTSGPPGTVLTVAGSGFDYGSQVGCPDLVPTIWVDGNQLQATVPVDIVGPAGTSQPIAVFVRDAEGKTSTVLLFTVEFPATTLQTWTTIDAVCGEVPGFERGGTITDEQILTWMRSVAQAIAAVMFKRGLSLDPSQWQQPDDTVTPTPAGVLEMLNRLGAASRLAAAIASQWGDKEWAVTTNLTQSYDDEMLTLREGDYDKLFAPSSVTVETGPQFSAGDMTNYEGRTERAFRKEQEF
jgi:hypothetical protein